MLIHLLFSKHPLCRELRMKVVTVGLRILNQTQLEVSLERHFRHILYDAALSWFSERPTWSYGADRLQLQEDMHVIQQLATLVRGDQPHSYAVLSSKSAAGLKQGDRSYPMLRPTTDMEPAASDSGAATKHASMQKLLLVHLESEAQRLAVWLNPLQSERRGTDPSIPTIVKLSEVGGTPGI